MRRSRGKSKTSTLPTGQGMNSDSGTHLVTEDAEDGEADDGQQPQPQQGHRHGPLVGWSDLAILFLIRSLEKYFFPSFSSFSALKKIKNIFFPRLFKIVLKLFCCW